MKSAEELKARLGANMKESMGRSSGAGGSPAAVPASAFHGETASAFHGETAKYQGAARLKDALAIEVDRLGPDPDQPRKEFDPAALAELAESLKARGQLQPIRVRWDVDVGRWIVVVGERRYRAALMAGLPTLMCIEAKGPMTADDILEDQLVENALREDLKPIEQARALRALIDRRGWSYRQLAEALHIAPASIARSLALLDLPGTVQEEVERGALAPSVAYEVSRLDGPAAQHRAAALVVEQGMTRTEATEMVRRTAGKAKASRGGKGRARKATSRTLRTSAGYRITVEHRRGVDDAGIRAALAEAMDQLEDEADAA
jgi:ParB family chromosome partitioning protein